MQQSAKINIFGATVHTLSKGLRVTCSELFHETSVPLSGFSMRGAHA